MWITDIIIFPFIILALTALGARLVRYLPEQPGPFGFLGLAGTLGTVILSFSTICLGEFGLLRPAWGVALLFVMALAAGVKGWKVLFSNLNKSANSFFAGLKIEFSFICLLRYACLFFLLMLFLAALAPPCSVDSLWHNLAIPSCYVKKGQLYPIYDIIPHGLFPQNGEMIFAFTLLFSKGMLAHLMVWWNLALGLLLAKAVCRRLNLPSGSPEVTAIIILTSPVVLQYACTGHVETFILSSFLALVLLGMFWNFSYPVCIFAGMFTGFLLGAKMNTLLYAGPVLLVAFLSNRSFRDIRKLAIFGFTVFLFGSFWYFRNWILIGNPAFPLLTGIFGSGDVAAIDMKIGVEEILNHPGHMERSLWGYLFGIPVFFIYPQDKFISSGPLPPLIIALLPVILGFAWTKTHKSCRWFVTLIILAFASSYTGMFFTQLSVRYMFSTLSLMIIASGGVFMMLRAESLKMRILLELSMILWLAFAFAGSIRYFYHPAMYLAKAQSMQQFLDNNYNSSLYGYRKHPYIKWLNAKVPADSKILIPFKQPFYITAHWIKPSHLRVLAKQRNKPVITAALDCGVNYFCLEKGFTQTPEFAEWKPFLKEIATSSDGKYVLFIRADREEPAKDNN